MYVECGYGCEGDEGVRVQSDGTKCAHTEQHEEPGRVHITDWARPWA